MKNSPYIKTAFLSTLIMAIYGAVPMIFVIQPPAKTQVLVFFSLLIVFAGIWAINISVFFLHEKKSKWTKYLFSFLLTMTFALIIRQFIMQYLDNPLNGRLPYYPLFIINTIILILMNQVDLRVKNDEVENRLHLSKIKQLEAEKKVLAQQLQPHFLFNALSTLKSLVRKKSNLAESYILKLSEFLRFTLEAKEEHIIPLKKELSFVQDYIDLQQMRFGSALTYHQNIERTINDAYLPVFALQTLIENAIKHNQLTVKNPLRIHIESQNRNLIVSNNWSPLSEKNDSTAMGLQNLKRRYAILGSYTVEISNDEESFMVSIPLLNSPTL